jgi:hypothetical protein
MATMKMKAGVTAVWGASEVGDPGYGKVLSAKRAHAAEKDFVYDEDGETVGEIFFDEKDELEIGVICKSGMTNPTTGNSITIATLAGLIQDWDIAWENRSTKKLNIKATKFSSALA